MYSNIKGLRKLIESLTPFKICSLNLYFSLNLDFWPWFLITFIFLLLINSVPELTFINRVILVVLYPFICRVQSLLMIVEFPQFFQWLKYVRKQDFCLNLFSFYLFLLFDILSFSTLHPGFMILMMRIVPLFAPFFVLFIQSDCQDMLELKKEGFATGRNLFHLLNV